MKKNTIMRIAAVVLMCTLVTACFASSTFARYTSATNEASSKATVANWEVYVNGGELTSATPPTVTFDLFNKSAIYDLDGLTNEQLADLSSVTNPKTEGDVNEQTNALVAPGTWGKVDFKVKNASDVTAKYSIQVTKLDNEIDTLKFSTDGKNWKSATDLGTPTFNLFEGTLKMNNADGEQTLSLYWKWDTGDATLGNHDTELGTAQQLASCDFTAKIVFEQVD